MASINFYAGEGFDIDHLASSGIGFYGSNSFGTSIAVGSYNSRTFITDSTGTAQGPEVDNCKYQSNSGVIVGQTGSGINLLALPNYLSTLNIRFTHSSPVEVQNVKLYGYDRVNKNNAPSGVNLYAAEIIHPDTTQTLSGSGSAEWVLLQGSGSILNLSSGPGTSGLSPNGPSTSDTRHDWHLAISSSPTTVGSHEYSLLCELEYL